MEKELEELKLALTSPRKRAPGTVASYINKARPFLIWLDGKVPPTERDLRLYFAHRREKGIGEGTLATEFSVLQKLFQANKWDWPLSALDRPVPPEEPFAPAFTQQEIETLIRARESYSPGETFYLALSTTYGLRGEDMNRVTKRDYDYETILIRTSKGGRQRRQPIPQEIVPTLQAYRPHIKTVRALSYMFHRIMEKSGLGHRKGYGWHCIRRTLDTLLPMLLAKNDLPPALTADFLRWKKRSAGTRFFGAPMAGVYSHPEILSDDPYHVDRLVLEVHPFIPLWAEPSS